MAFFGDVLFTGKHLGPLTKWIVVLSPPVPALSKVIICANIILYT